MEEFFAAIFSNTFLTIFGPCSWFLDYLLSIRKKMNNLILFVIFAFLINFLNGFLFIYN